MVDVRRTLRAASIMIDHISIAVSNLAVSAKFYQTALEPLGMTLLVDAAARVAFGSKYPELWLNARPKMSKVAAETGAHVGLRAKSTSAVDAFHQRALAAGGRFLARAQHPHAAHRRPACHGDHAARRFLVARRRSRGAGPA